LELQRSNTIKLVTKNGEFNVICYKDDSCKEFLVCYKGNLQDDPSPLLRIHSACLFGDTLHALDCDCGLQLQASLHLIATEGRGILIYADEEGRGLGLFGKVESIYLEQTQKLDTMDAYEHLGVAADLRDYKIAIAILKDLSVSSVRLMTNNPNKVLTLEEANIKVNEVISFQFIIPSLALPELLVKRDKFGHKILVDEVQNAINNGSRYLIDLNTFDK
jgi:GTP cyclohydrolase II